MTNCFAFFDFDHTVIDADAGPLFGSHLFRHQHGSSLRRRIAIVRFIPFASWMVLQAGLYKVGARRRSSIVRSAYMALRGFRRDVFETELDNFVASEIPPRMFPEVLAEMSNHLRAGRRVVILTTGMETLVRRALPYLPTGVELVGCRLLEKRGRFTGRVEGPLYGVDKANILEAFCRATGVDPAECYAYSDHWSDKQMLEAVGHPVVVHPRGRLRRLAEERGWRIMTPDPTSSSDS